MALGNAFPPGYAQSSAIRQLKPGAVIKVRATLDDGREKEKRFIVVGVTDSTICCVVNTEIHPIIQRNAGLLKCQVFLEASHDFVSRNCYADCSRFRVFSTEEVVAQLVDNPEWMLGRITSTLRDQVMAAIKSSDLIAPVDAARCCDALASETDLVA